MWLCPYHLSVCQKYLGEWIISTVETRSRSVSSEASRLYKNTDARHRVSTKTQTRGFASLQKHRREASRLYKNTDARHRVSTKTEMRGFAFLQKQRREASRLYKNTDARLRVYTKTQTRGIAKKHRIIENG